MLFRSCKIDRFLLSAAAVIVLSLCSEEERRNIKLAMRIRGVTPKNPLKYLEYVAIPIITISLNIADDISKSAETKCIAMPCQKVRYNEVKSGLADIVFLSIIVLIEIGGRLCWR